MKSHRAVPGDVFEEEFWQIIVDQDGPGRAASS